MTIDARTQPAASTATADFGPAVALSAASAASATTSAPSYACAECFGPLEIAYDFPGDPVTREQIEAGPTSIWRYAPLLPVPADVAAQPNLNPGWTRLVTRRPPRPRARACARCGSRTTPATRPTPSRTASWPSRSRPPAPSASPRSPAPPPATWPARSAAAAARAGLRSLRVHPRRPGAGKIVMAAVYGGELVAIDGTYDDVNRLCSRAIGDESARTGASSTSTCGRSTPRAPRPSATRSPSSSAGGCRSRSSSRSRPARC